MTETKVVICPYCGEAQSASERCRACGGLFEPLSRQATHNAMGPWFLRDPGKPFHPGCSYETMVRMIDRGQVTKYSLVRGPTTKQFWTVARHVPGLAHLLGYCHNCDTSVDSADHGCHVCGVPFGAYLSRNHLGLPEVRPLPWEAEVDGRGAGEPGAAGVDAMGGPPRGGAISGFATDEELLDPGPVHVPTSAAPAGDGYGAAAPEGASIFDSHASSAATRALRRKVEAQQRMIRMLAIALGLVAVVSVVMTIVTTRQGSAGMAPPLTAAPSPVAAQGADQQQTQQPTARDPVATPPPTESTVEQVEAEPAAVVDPEVAAYTRARQLIASAGRVGRTPDERIDDLERALEELKTLDATAWAALPENLAQSISQAERELERLRLERDFFGGGG